MPVLSPYQEQPDSAAAEDQLTAAIVATASAVLGREIGPAEDMLTGNADTLGALRIARGLATALARPVPVRTVLEARTAQALAHSLGDAGAAVEPEPSELRWLAGLPVPQWRFWYREVKQPGNGDGIDTFVFRIEGQLDVAALSNAFQVVVARHEALHTVIRRVGTRGTKAELLDPQTLPSVLRVEQLADPDASSGPLEAFATAPFDLETEPPIRALLLTSAGERQLLVVCVHHTAFDGWSAGLLFTDIGSAYRELRAGNTPRARRPSQYRRTWLEQDAEESPAERAELLEWTRELIGVPDLPLLDTAGDVPPPATAAISEQWIPMPAAFAERIANSARRGNCTPSALLLAAWVRALRTVTGALDFAIGVPISGRTSTSATNVIGCFVSAVALRFRAQQGKTPPEDDVRTAKQGLAKAMRFQFMPLERVSREDAPRDRHRIPFCQAGFVVQQPGTTALELDGVRSTYLHRARPDSAFELTLEFWEGDEPKARIWRRQDVLDDAASNRLATCWIDELTEITAQLLEDDHAQL